MSICPFEKETTAAFSCMFHARTLADAICARKR